MIKKFCKKHLNCPYCDHEQGEDRAKCCREGCLFMYPCALSNDKDNPYRKGQ